MPITHVAAHLRDAAHYTWTHRPVVRRFKVGGIWFVRIGRLQMAFCLCRRRTINRAGRPAP